MWKLEQHRLTPKYFILRSFVLQVKHYHVTYVDDDTEPLKITCQPFNVFTLNSGKSEELIYITFLHAVMEL